MRSGAKTSEGRAIQPVFMQHAGYTPFFAAASAALMTWG